VGSIFRNIREEALLKQTERVRVHFFPLVIPGILKEGARHGAACL
jgi:hypothetical protein